MPGYIGFVPQFEPISLQEYLAVPTQIIGEYKEAEKEYNETATKAEALKALLGERNPENEAGWRIVDNYERQLGDLADNMSRGIQGPETYRQAKNAQRYYRENMLPLESGIPAYQEELKRWESDPTMIGKRPYLGTYIANPLYREDMLSGNIVQQEAMKAAAAASVRRRSNPKEGKAFNGTYYSATTQVGFSPEEVKAWLNNPTSSPELTAIYNQIASKYGRFAPEQVGQYIIRGILDGIAYDSKTDYKENPYTKASIEYNIWKQKMAYTTALKAAQEAAQQEKDNPVTTMPSTINKNDDPQIKKNESFNKRLLWYKKHPKDIIYNIPTQNEFLKGKLTPEEYKLYEQYIINANKKEMLSGTDAAKGAIVLSSPNVKNAIKEYNDLKKKYENTQEFIGWINEAIKYHPELNLKRAFAFEGTPENNYKLEMRLNLTPEVIEVLDDLTTKNYAFKTTPLTFNLTETANKQLIKSLFTKIGVEGDRGNLYIIDEDGDLVSNTNLREIKKDYNAQIYVDKNQWVLESNGKTYYIKQGAFGDRDNEVRTLLNNLYNEGEITEYDRILREYMKMLADDARTKAKGQSETDSNLDDELLP